MRITYWIGGALVLASAIAVPAAQAFQGPGGGNPPGVMGPPAGRPTVHVSGEAGMRGGDDSSSKGDTHAAVEAELRKHRMLNASFTAQLKEKGADVPQVFQERRKEMIASIQMKREEFQQKIAVMHDEAKIKFAAKKDELKAKIEAFKDKKKGEAASHLDTTLGNANANWVAFFGSSVDQIEKVLDAISSRTDKAQTAGKDVAAVRTKIDAATAAITTARAAIEAQAGKDYTLEVSSEDTVKADASGSVQQLRTDLKAVRTVVKAAYDATKAAAQALKAIPGVEEVEIHASSTASTTTQ